MFGRQQSSRLSFPWQKNMCFMHCANYATASTIDFPNYLESLSITRQTGNWYFDFTSTTCILAWYSQLTISWVTLVTWVPIVFLTVIYLVRREYWTNHWKGLLHIYTYLLGSIKIKTDLYSFYVTLRLKIGKSQKRVLIKEISSQLPPKTKGIPFAAWHLVYPRVWAGPVLHCGN